MFQNNFGEKPSFQQLTSNRMSSYILDFKIPFSTLQTFFPTNKIFSSIPLKIFGCSAFVHNLNPHFSKLDPKSIKCIFLGYSPHQKRYWCYSLPKVGIQGEQPNTYLTENSKYQPLALEITESALLLHKFAQTLPDHNHNAQIT